MEIILENLYFELGLLGCVRVCVRACVGVRHACVAAAIVFPNKFFVSLFSYVYVHEHVEVCGKRLRPQHRRTR